MAGHRPFDELRKAKSPKRSAENASATHCMLKDEKSKKVIYKITYPTRKFTSDRM
jgi:hypothetical protein